MTMTTIDPSVWYQAEIGTRLSPSMRFIFDKWSGLRDEELIAHLHQIRAKAWPLGQYPCIGLWMFLLPSLATFPQFPAILDQAKKPDGAVLDLGCGLGQDLRLLAVNGVPTNRMWAVDAEAGLWELGFELFRDPGRMEAKFIHGDFLDLECETLCGVEGKVNVVIAAQFLHLFNWDRQLAANKAIVRLSKPGTMLVGYQQGRRRARGYIRPWGMMFYHNWKSLTQLWEIIQRETKTKWTVDVKEVSLQEWGMQEEDLEWMPEDRMGINFVVTRVS